jgi:uncharacterized protein (TIGR00730 family)
MSASLKSVAVFCGSSPGIDPIYRHQAFETGIAIAQRGLKLVYGGAKIGLMGAVAYGALSRGGEVVGVIPGFLKTKEIANPDLSELITVETMHERKLVMHELSDAIIALPGGWGTMEELMEILTWAQLGLHSKPIGLLNINGFYNGLIQLVASMQQNGLLRDEYATMLIVEEDVNLLFEALKAYEAPAVQQWLVAEET